MMILTKTVISLREHGRFDISAAELAREHHRIGYSLSEDEAAERLPDIIIDLDHERPDLFPFHLTNDHYTKRGRNVVFQLTTREWLVALSDARNDENYLLAKSFLPWFIKSMGIRFAVSRNDFLSCVAHHLFASSLYGRQRIYTEKIRNALQKGCWPTKVGALLLGENLEAITDGMNSEEAWPKELRGQAMDYKIDLKLLEADMQKNFMSKGYRRKHPGTRG